MNPVGDRHPGRSESPDRSRHTDTGRAWRLGPDQSQETLGTGVLKNHGRMHARVVDRGARMACKGGYKPQRASSSRPFRVMNPSSLTRSSCIQRRKMGLAPVRGR
jgi:hypothetical protein